MSNLKLLKPAGDGAFGDVWEATDQLGRRVAVKIIRPAQVNVADALAHAKALARVNHENVVTVHQISQVIDPITEQLVDCIVMEFIEGETLAIRLKQPSMSANDTVSIGRELISAIKAIHAGGIVHGDLHEENVMLKGKTVKVIDILYLDSLAIASTETKQKRLMRDISSLRFLIQDLISRSEFGPSRAKEFNNALEVNPSVDDLLSALENLNTKGTLQSPQENCVEIINYLTDAAFDDSTEYASAVFERLIVDADLILLKNILEQKLYLPKHRKFVDMVWARLLPHQKNQFSAYAGTQLDSLIPTGPWSPALQMVSGFGAAFWQALPNLTKLRLERLILTDTLAGRKNVHSEKILEGGALGTYARSLWPLFVQKNALADNLLSLLRQSWFTQNYVGEFFMEILAPLANATGKRDEFVSAIRGALSNDARVIKNNLGKLPADWQLLITTTEA